VEFSGSCHFFNALHTHCMATIHMQVILCSFLPFYDAMSEDGEVIVYVVTCSV
jgi:hypothetical protein